MIGEWLCLNYVVCLCEVNMGLSSSSMKSFAVRSGLAEGTLLEECRPILSKDDSVFLNLWRVAICAHPNNDSYLESEGFEHNLLDVMLCSNEYPKQPSFTGLVKSENLSWFLFDECNQTSK